MSKKQNFWIASIFIGYILLSLTWMYDKPLSDDQTTYWVKAYKALDPTTHQVHWDPTASFSYILALFYLFFQNINYSFLALYGFTAILYLFAMKKALENFIHDNKSSILVSIASLTPFYTLAMTYWGFASFEFIKARILIMPFVPLVMMYYYHALVHKKPIFYPLLLCASLCLLNFEAAYLSASLTLHFLFFGKKYQAKASHYLTSASQAFLALGVVILIYKLRVLLNAAFDSTTTNPIHDWLGFLTELHRPYIYSLEKSEYLELIWNAVHEAFWWTTFPPRITDIAFALINASGVILVSIYGWRILSEQYPKVFRWIIQWILCVVIVAYGYQSFLFVTRHLIGFQPDIFEEVRVIKFVLFGFYIACGLTIKELFFQKKYFLIIVCSLLLFISPIETLRSLSNEHKQMAVKHISQFVSNPTHLTYLNKAFQINNISINEDIKQMNMILKNEFSKRGKKFVLTDLHEIKQSGMKTMLTYQDKRGGRSHNFTERDRRKDPIVLWYITYNEVKDALSSKDSKKINDLALRLQCEYIVSPFPIENPHWKALYTGSQYNLYSKV